MAQQTGARARALVIISTIAVFLVLLLASAVYAAGDDLATGDDPATTAYRVRSGDTLWEIASDRGPVGGDVRKVVEIIRKVNGLETTIIHPGQLIEIPTR